MTRQRLNVVIDALTVEGGGLSRAALTRAIEAALAERLATAAAPLRPEATALARLTATARRTPQDKSAETAVGRAVAGAAERVLNR